MGNDSIKKIFFGVALINIAFIFCACPENKTYVSPVTSVNAYQTANTNEVRISWNDSSSSNRAGYNVYFSNSSDFNSATTLASKVYSSTDYNLKLDYGGYWYFWVEAFDYEGNRSAATKCELNVTYYDECLTEVEGLYIETTSTKNTIKIGWNQTTDATTYRIYWSTVDDASLISDNSFFNSASVYDNYYNKVLSETETYYFWVKSIDSSTKKASKLSSSVKYNFNYEEISEPTDLKIEAVTNQNNHIKLSWSTDAPYFTVWKNTKNDISYAKGLSFSYNPGYYIFYLSQSGTYYFWVGAYDYSTSDYKTASAEPYVFEYSEPSVPTNLTVQKHSNASTDYFKNYVTISWTGNANYYWIYYGTSNNKANATLIKTSESPYNLELENSGTYYFWIRGADGYDNSYRASNFSNYVTYAHSAN